MPKFELDTSGGVRKAQRTYEGLDWPEVYWRELDSFTQGYIEALFFTESSPAFTAEEWDTPECVGAQEEGTADGTIPGDVGFSDLAPQALAEILADCAAFQEKARDLLEQAYERGYTEEQAGADYWFTRNGLGVGYWERDELKPDSEEYERLTDIMVAAGADNAAWSAACAKRNALESIGDKLTKLAEYDEIDVYFDGKVRI